MVLHHAPQGLCQRVECSCTHSHPVVPAPSLLFDASSGSASDALMALPTLLCFLPATCALRCCVVFRCWQHLHMLLCYLCNILHWLRRHCLPVWFNVRGAVHHHLNTLVTHRLPEVVEHLPFGDCSIKATPHYALFYSNLEPLWPCCSLRLKMILEILARNTLPVHGDSSCNSSLTVASKCC